MTNAELAAVLGLALLVVALAVLVWRVSRQVRRLGAEVADLRSESPPPVPPVELVETKAGPRTEGSRQARPPVTEPVPLITQLADETLTDADDLTTARVASVTLGPPLIKAAAFTYGVRRALGDEQRMRVSYAVRKELRRQRKLRRRSSRAVASEGVGRP